MAFGTVETFGTGVAGVLMSWLFAGSGVFWVVEILETLGIFGTFAVCISAFRSFVGSGVVRVVGILGTLGTLVTAGSGDAAAVEGSSTGYWARQGWPGRV